MTEPREDPSAVGGGSASADAAHAAGARVVEPRGGWTTSGPGGQGEGRRNGEVSPEERQHLRQVLSVLTPREHDVVEAIWAGGSNEAVAERMCVAIPTLRTHLMRIHRKLGTRGKGDLIRFVAEQMLEGYRAGRLNGRVSAGRASRGEREENAKSSLSMTTAAAESSQ